MSFTNSINITLQTSHGWALLDLINCFLTNFLGSYVTKINDERRLMTNSGPTN